MKRFRVLLIISALLLVLIISFISTFEILSVNQAIEEFNGKFSSDAEKAEFSFVSTSDSSIIAKQVEYAYINAQFEASKSDSISLTLNFLDSTANLMIKGVVVHSAKIENYQLSRFVDAVDQVALYRMLSLPLQVTGHTSTIAKVPLMVKIAPKDTSEYTPDVVPDTTDIDAVNYIFETSSGIQLYFYESNPRESADGLKQFKFDFMDRVQSGYELFKATSTFKKPEYHPEIRIKLKKRDAKMIYRALPENASIVLKIR
ncbi:MAG TPA: hypothetical protein PLH91_03300 [Tenuifilaceae bacterium]|nr:hypothetical protein [Tenuifilaceae bacterium]HPI44234.1 hypothetical protein [Tenuifilaceae bacterium]HPN20842.1 hypothetical protein [Tenuifilaceae bacterium]